MIEFPFHLEKNLNFQRYNFLIGILDVCRIPRIYLNEKINFITSLRLLFYSESMRESSPYIKYSMQGLILFSQGPILFSQGPILFSQGSNKLLKGIVCCVYVQMVATSFGQNCPPRIPNLRRYIYAHSTYQENGFISGNDVVRLVP